MSAASTAEHSNPGDPALRRIVREEIAKALPKRPRRVGPHAFTTTTRVGLPQWGAGTDAFTRVQMNAAMAQLESLMAIDSQGLLSARPSAATRGRYYWATDTGDTYRADGTSWNLVYPAYGTPSGITAGQSTAAGTAHQTARADHAHGIPGYGTSPSSVTVGASAAAGSSTSFARGDHTHGAPSAAAAGAATPGDSAAAGSAATVSLSDHRHSLPPWASSATSVSGASAGVAGTAASFARGDHTHTLGTPSSDTPGTSTPGDTAAAGTSASVALADHRHGMLPFGAAPPSVTAGGSSATGAGANYARGDHGHGLAAASAVGLATGVSSGAGSSSSVARADHVHATPTNMARTDQAQTFSGTQTLGDAVVATRSLPRGIVAIDTATTNSGAIGTGTSTELAAASSFSATWTFIAGRRYRLVWFGATVAGGDDFTLRLRDGSTAGAQLQDVNTKSGSITSLPFYVEVVVDCGAGLDITAGSHTIFPTIQRLGAATTAGEMTAAGNTPAQVYVEDMGAQ